MKHPEENHLASPASRFYGKEVEVSAQAQTLNT